MPLAAAISAVLAGTPPAHAQEQADAGVLGEVLVTAQKRTENLQEVPLSIQTFGNEQLEELNITDFNDYVKFLPSVSFETLGPGFARVYMRGVAAGDNGNHSGSLPSVGMYLDEQPITTIQGALDVHLYDIARVESLAGPQGTLYGASSQGGTIRIITNKPDPSRFSAGYDLQANALAEGDNGYVGEAFVNIPLSETAAIRLVGWYRYDGGYIDNVPGTLTIESTGECVSSVVPTPAGCDAARGQIEDDYNDIDTYGARAALRVNLNDSWSISPTLMAQKQTSNGFFAFDPSVGDLEVTHWYPESSDDRWLQAALTVEGRISNFDVVYAGSYLKRDVDTEADYADYAFFYDRLPDYGYDYFSTYYRDNDGNLINPSQYIQGKDRYERHSHELRFSSPADQRLRYVAGLFAQRSEHGIEQRYLVDNLVDAGEVTGWPDTLWLTEQMRVDRDYAVFGEMTYDFTDHFALTGGLRFFKADNSLEGFFGFGLNNIYGSGTGEPACTGLASVAGAPCNNLEKSVKEEDFTHRLTATYKFDDARMIYATWSTGFRPGGVNRRGTFPPYDADFLTNYEIGWKTSWAGNRLRFNGAVFYQRWDDFQFSFLGENGLTNITNADQAAIPGVEADLLWAATADLTLSTGFMLVDPELGANFCEQLDADGNQLPQAACPVTDFAAEGTQLPVTPKEKAYLTARYTFALGSFNAHVQGAFVHNGSSRSALIPFEESILGDQGSYDVADFTFGFENDSFQVELFVNNAFDERAVLSHFAECDTEICGTRNYVVTNEPRTYGIKFGQRF